MRMRGLEPPPSYLDTDLNRACSRQMCPGASRSSILRGFADALDASDDMTVAKLLPRGAAAASRSAGGFLNRLQEADGLASRRSAGRSFGTTG
jgi:hypothetical protein